MLCAGTQQIGGARSVAPPHLAPMPTRDDRRAAVLLLLLAAAGLVVRFWQPPVAAPGAAAYRAPGPRPTQDSLAARAARLARPLARDERIDLDRAPAEELARLPRVGPGLAARIVADREEHGPFGSLEALDRVPGVGPTALAAIRPHATFSAAGLVGGNGPAAVRRTDGSPLIRHPGDAAPPASPAGRVGRREDKVSLNTASEAELTQLPGIGPALARAIVEDRRARGPYRTLQDLRRVRGLGAAKLRALEPRIIVP